MSWDEAFADRYEEWSAGMTADVAFYVELAVEADGPLVELAIGNGRVAIPVAQATGKPVIGIDMSPAMLDHDLTLADGARSSLWWATKNEWLGLIDVAGLELEALYGGFAGEPFDDDSREYVFVTRK
jgi:hypothetical protein